MSLIYNNISKLESAGFTRLQIEALIELKGDAVNEANMNVGKEMMHRYELSESRLEKAFQSFQHELLQEMHAMRMEMTQIKADMKADMNEQIHQLKTEMALLLGDVRLIKGLAVFIAGFVAIIAAFPGIFNFARHFFLN